MEKASESKLKAPPAEGQHGFYALAIRKLNYYVRVTKDRSQELHILQDVSALFLPGCLAAIMGPSGSGKTTLLDVLAGRKTQGRAEGAILYGNRRSSPAFLKRRTGYVEQFDTLIDVLSVEEMLMYTAELKRSPQEPRTAKAAAVAQLVTDLGLEGCRGTQIGNPLKRGISGGQAKRVNVGLALIADPDVLFLDEPTSGLDSATADDIVALVKALVLRRGITAVSTIHSPSESTFAFFDDLLLLVGGRTVYCGPVAASMDHFLSLGCAYDPRYSLCEWLVAITAPEKQVAAAEASAREKAIAIIDEPEPAAAAQAVATPMFAKRLRSFARDVDFPAAYAASALNQGLLAELARRLPPGEPPSWPQHETASETTTSTLGGVLVLARYRTYRSFTNPEYVISRNIDKLIISFFVFSLYLFVGSKTDPASINNTVGVLFMFSISPALGAVTQLPIIVMGRRLLARERADGLYFASTFVIWRLLEEAVMALFSAALVIGVNFWSVQLQGSAGGFYLTYYMLLLCGMSCAYAVGSIAPSISTANSALPSYMSIQAFFVGVMILEDKIPVYWSWFKYLSFIRYGWRAYMGNQFGPEGLNNPILFAQRNLSTLQYYSLADETWWHNLGWLSIFVAGFATWMYLAVAYVKHEQR